MKTNSILILLIIFTSSIFAQIDTIYTKKGHIYPCTIIELDDEKINTIDNSGSELKVYLFLIDKVYFDSYDEIYTAEKGYTADVDELEPALEWRLEQLEKQNDPEEESDEDEIAGIKSNSTNAPKDFIKRHEGSPKFSFGILYVPTAIDQRIVYYDSYSSSYSIIYDYSTLIESQLSYNLHKGLFVTLNLAYTSASVKIKYVRQQVNTDPVNTYDEGTEMENALKQFTFEFGIKYYFKEFFSNKVSAFVLAGIGKTTAYAKEEYKILFQDEDPDYSISDNSEEYLEDLSSPFLFQIGFGTEYFFNEYLSLHSSIRLYYSTVSGEYKETYTSPSYQRTTIREKEESDVSTKVGLGINFYF
jgi:hypothetical protein